MSRFVITGGTKLEGEIVVEGSKNAVLPILAASLLNGGESIIKNCPRLRDVEVMIEILKKIGCSAKMEGDVITINSSSIRETQIPVDLAAEMRSSIIFMGPMLARCGKVTISYPGGCVTLWSLSDNWIIFRDYSGTGSAVCGGCVSCSKALRQAHSYRGGNAIPVRQDFLA